MNVKNKTMCRCSLVQRVYRDPVSFSLLMVSCAMFLLSFLFYMMPIIIF